MEPWHSVVTRNMEEISRVIGYQQVYKATPVNGGMQSVIDPDDPRNEVIARIRDHLLDVSCGVAAIMGMQKELEEANG